jgi:hypothetical protein
MSDHDNPMFKFLISPQFTGADEAVGIDVVLVIESPDIREDSIIVSFPSSVKPTISKAGFKFIDEKGEITSIYRAWGSGTGPGWTVEARVQCIIIN